MLVISLRRPATSMPRRQVGRADEEGDGGCHSGETGRESCSPRLGQVCIVSSTLLDVQQLVPGLQGICIAVVVRV